MGSTDVAATAKGFEAAGILDSATHYWLEAAGKQWKIVWRGEAEYVTVLRFLEKAEQLVGDAAPATNPLSFKVHLKFYHYYAETGDFDRAIQHRLIVRPETASLDEHLSQIYYHLGTVQAEKLNKPAQAIDYFQKAIGLFETMPRWKVKIPQGYLRMGELYWQMQQPEQARHYIQQAINYYRQHLVDRPQYYRLSEAYLKMALVQRAMGEYLLSIDFNLQGFEIIRQQPESVLREQLMVRHLGGIGTSYLIIEEYASGQKYLREALDLCSIACRNPQLHQDIQMDLAAAEAFIGNNDAARILLQAIEADLASGTDITIRGILTRLVRPAQIYAQMGDRKRAIYLLNRALSEQIEAYGTNNIMTVGTAIAKAGYLIEFGEIAEAGQVMETVINPWLTTRLDSLFMPDYDHASIIYYLPACFSSVYFKSLILKAKYLENGEVQVLEEALKLVEILVGLFETYQISLENRTQLQLKKSWPKVYATAVEFYLELARQTGEQRYLERAFRLAAASKATTLLNMITTKKETLNLIPDSLADAQKQLAMQIRLAETKHDKLLSGQATESSRRTTQAIRVFDLRRKYDLLQRDIREGYPDYYSLPSKLKENDTDSLQLLLPSNAATIIYMISDSLLHAFAMTSDTLMASSTALRTEDLQSLANFAADIQAPSKVQQWPAQSHKLYQLLLGPLLPVVAEKERLMIIPEGPLHRFPFEALLTKAPSENMRSDFQSLPYLIREKEISYHISAGLLTTQLHHQERQMEFDAEFGGFAPVFDEEYHLRESLSQRGFLSMELFSVKQLINLITRDNHDLKALPYSAVELRLITRLFRANQKSAEGFFYGDASERSFKRNAHRFRYLHLATHSFVNKNYRSLSGIAFFKPADPDSIDDGVLYTSEIYDLNLNADLIVLSSCESGNGEIVDGEGIVGITRAFIHAGARNLLVSLWAVYDQYASKMMVKFYQHLLAGESYANALRKAKLAMLNDPGTAHPAIWSSFVFLGH